MATAHQIEAFRQSWRPTQEKVDLAVKTAIDVAKPSRVFVFGSWARGNATPESDLDLAVLLPDDRKEEIAALRKQILRHFSDIRMSIDLLLETEDDLATFGSLAGTVYFDIANEGKLVYEQSR